MRSAREEKNPAREIYDLFSRVDTSTLQSQGGKETGMIFFVEKGRVEKLVSSGWRTGNPERVLTTGVSED